MMAGAFDLILRGLDLGGESPVMAALRKATRCAPARGRELSEDEPWMKDRPSHWPHGYMRGMILETGNTTSG